MLEKLSAAILEVLLLALSLLLGVLVVWALATAGVLSDGSMLLGSAMLGTAGLVYLYFERMLGESSPVGPLVSKAERAPVGKSALIGLAALAAALAGANVIGLVQQWVFDLAPTEQTSILDTVANGSALDLWLLGISAIVLAPLTEELLFRHMLFRRLLHRAGPTLAWILPAVAFSLFHFNPSGVAVYVWLGLVFALAYLFSGRLAVAMAVHGTYNATAFALLLWWPDAL